MNISLCLDVAELMLKKSIPPSTVTYCSINELYYEFISGQTLAKSKATKNELKKAVKIICPIYKNVRRKNKIIKISVPVIYNTCRSLNLNLRKYEDIMREYKNEI